MVDLALPIMYLTVKHLHSSYVPWVVPWLATYVPWVVPWLATYVPWVVRMFRGWRLHLLQRERSK